MRRARLLTIFVLATCLILLISLPGLCDVSPGDVLDKTNWEKAEGLVPDELLGWIKKGDFVLKVGELNYKPRDHQPAYALEALSANRGKYALDENDWIVEKETGERGNHIVGHPFPGIDPDDPKAAEKIMYNSVYGQYIGGNLIAPFSMDYIKSSGYGRSVKGLLHNLVMDGTSAWAIPSIAHDTESREDVCAVVVKESGAELTEAEVMEYTSTRLAKFQKPKWVIFIDALPKNALGKVLKKELRAQYGN